MIDLRKLADILQPPDRFLGHEAGGQVEALPTYNPVIPPPDPRANDIVAPNGSRPDLSRFQPVQPATIAPVEQGRPLLAMPPPTGGLVYDTTSTPTEPEAMPPRIVVSPARRTQSEIDQIETKDYSKRPNPNYDPTKPATTRHTKTGDTNNKYVYGKDYDRSRGFKDFLRSAGLGALGGFLRGGIGGAIGGAATGGIRGAINPNTDNQMLDQMKLDQLYPQYQRQFETETARQKAEQDRQYRQAQTDTIYADDKRQRDDLERKATKDAAQIKYWERKADQGDWKLINDEKLMELRDKWAESKDVNDKRRLDLVEKEMTYRNVRSKLDRESRERLAGWRESGLNRRQQLASEARQLLTQFQEAQRNNRAEEQRALQERLTEIKIEAQANP